MNKLAYIAYAVAWIATSAAIIYAIYTTGRIVPLWFFIFPACVSITSMKISDKERDDNGKAD